MEFLPTCTGIEAWLEWITLFMMNDADRKMAE